MTRKEMQKPLKKMKKIDFNHTGLPINTLQIKITRTNYVSNENYIHQTSDFIKLLKIDLDNFSVDRFFERLTNPINLKFLSDNKIFINDLDFTQDFGGLNKKKKLLFDFY